MELCRRCEIAQPIKSRIFIAYILSSFIGVECRYWFHLILSCSTKIMFMLPWCTLSSVGALKIESNESIAGFSSRRSQLMQPKRIRFRQQLNMLARAAERRVVSKLLRRKTECNFRIVFYFLRCTRFTWWKWFDFAFEIEQMHSQHKCILQKSVCPTKCENGVRKYQDCKCCRCGANTIFNIIIQAFICIPRALSESVDIQIDSYMYSHYGSIWLLCSRRRQLSHIPKGDGSNHCVYESCTRRGISIGSSCGSLSITSAATYIFMIWWHHTNSNISFVSLLFFYVYEAKVSSITIYSNTPNSRLGSHQIII